MILNMKEIIKLPRHLYLLHEAQYRLETYIKQLENQDYKLEYGKRLVKDINDYIECELLNVG